MRGLLPNELNKVFDQGDTFFYSTGNFMIRVSSHKLEHLTLEVLGPLFQIGGIFVSLAAVWIVTIEVIGGIALTFADLGVEALGSGLSLFVVGTLFIKTIEAVAEEEDRSYLLPFVATASSSTSISPSVVPTVSGCASCGYKNHNGGFFCVACNSPLWPKGTPIGEPPARSVVERRIRRVIAVQKAKHFSLLAIIAIAISAPLATNLATGYIAVSDSSLRTEVGFIGSAIGQPNGTLLLNVYLWSDGVKQYLYLSSPAYIVTIGDMPK